MSQNITKHELIGRDVQVIESTDPTHLGISGRVVGETKNILSIQSKEKEIIIQKIGSTFRFQLEKEVVDLQGEVIVSRPEDKIKKR